MKLLGLAIFLALFVSSAFGGAKWYVPTEKDALKRMGAIGSKIVEKENINILIWNAHKEGFDRPWQNEFNQLRQGMDFVLLQESLTKLSFFLTDLIFPPVYKDYAGVAGFSFYLNGKFNGNVNLSYYDAVDAKVLHSPDREPVVNTVKPVLISRYRLVSGELLTLANIHAINFVDWRAFGRQITKTINYLKDLKGPIVFGGDFNTWNQAKLDFLQKSLSAVGFKQVNLRHPERVKKVFDFPIDHIFVRDAHIIDADYLINKTSDHTPMLLTLKVN